MQSQLDNLPGIAGASNPSAGAETEYAVHPSFQSAINSNVIEHM
jgi:hypothetical protein